MAHLNQLLDERVVDEARIAQRQLLRHRRVALLVPHHVAPERHRHGHGVLLATYGRTGMGEERQSERIRDQRRVSCCALPTSSSGMGTPRVPFRL